MIGRASVEAQNCGGRELTDEEAVVMIWVRAKGLAKVKASAYNVGDLGLILGCEDPLEREMATHSSILAGESHGWRSLVG